jgi:hypothetical protein
VISSLGYKTYTSEIFELKQGLVKDFGTLLLADELTGLDEVTVNATRPQIIIEPDKTIVNVEGTVMAEGANALDVLGRSPGVFITSDGSINLNGRTGVTVMINDRPMYMSAADLTSFLRSMSADNIKSIEVITSPSARFDAEGAAGVINIQLKKNTVDGVFGNVMLGGQYNGKAAPNTGLTLNVKKGKWTSNGTVNYNEYVEINDLEIELSDKQTTYEGLGDELRELFDTARSELHDTLVSDIISEIDSDGVDYFINNLGLSFREAVEYYCTFDESGLERYLAENEDRGNTLSGYDGSENEEYYNGVTYYIYRTD